MRTETIDSSAAALVITAAAIALSAIPFLCFSEAKRRRRKQILTKWKRGPNDEVEIGTLADLSEIPNEWKQPYQSSLVFISHTNQDGEFKDQPVENDQGIKELIARPTHWFVKSVLDMEAFLDDEDAARICSFGHCETSLSMHACSYHHYAVVSKSKVSGSGAQYIHGANSRSQGSIRTYNHSLECRR